MDNRYNKQFTTNPDKNDKSLNATALVVLLLRDAPRYWHGHPNLEELERRVPIVARMLSNRTQRGLLHAFCVTWGWRALALLSATSGHCLMLFVMYLLRDRNGDLFA